MGNTSFLNIAKDSTTPIKVLEELANTAINGHKTLLALCVNPSTSSAILANILRHVQKHDSLKYFWNHLLAMAKHPNVTKDILLGLCEFDDDRIRRNILFNPRISAEIIECMQPYIKWHPLNVLIAKHSKTPKHIINKMAKNFDDFCIQELARKNPNCANTIANDGTTLEDRLDDFYNRYRLNSYSISTIFRPGQPLLPLSFLEKLSAGTYNDQLALAGYRKLPRQLIDRLSKSRDPKVRRRLLENPRVPAGILLMMYNKRSNKKLQNLIKEHKNCPVEVKFIVEMEK